MSSASAIDGRFSAVAALEKPAAAYPAQSACENGGDERAAEIRGVIAELVRVDEAGVDSVVRVDVPRAAFERIRRAAVRVDDLLVGRSHQRRLQLRRRPIGMRLLEQRRDARHLGRRLRRSRVVGVALPLHAVRGRRRHPARMSTPGAVTSGFRKFAVGQRRPARGEVGDDVAGRRDRDEHALRELHRHLLRARERGEQRWPSAAPIITAGMCDTARVAVHHDRLARGVVVDHRRRRRPRLRRS